MRIKKNKRRKIDNLKKSNLCIDERSEKIREHKEEIFSYVLGSFHQGDERFGESAGTQCVSISLLSIIYDNIKSVKHWNTTDLDRILITGNELYEFLQCSSSISNRYLLISELPSTIHLFDTVFNIDTQEESLVGLIDVKNINGALYEALQTNFNTYNSCFITFGGNTFSVIKKQDAFYIFDSHSRSKEGLVDPEGLSVLKKVKTINLLFNQCIELANSMNLRVQQFELTGINVFCKNARPNDVNSGIGEIERSSDQFSTRVVNKGDDDISIAGIETRCFSFKPLGLQEKDNCCQKLNIRNTANSKTDVIPCVIAQPDNIKQIIGDGNCLFRSLSYSISGTENNHLKLRKAIVNHMKENELIFKPYLRQPFKSVQDYIYRSRIDKSGTWGTEIELFAAADLLQTYIYTYSNNKWLQFTTLQSTNKELEDSGAIYIYHSNQSHYDVVVNVIRNIEIRNKDISNVSSCKPSPNINKRKRKRGNKWCIKKKHDPNDAAKKMVYDHERYLSSKQSNTENDVNVQYKNSKTYKQLKKKHSQMRYSVDSHFRLSKIKKSKNKYKTITKFKLSVKLYSQMKYKTNVDHKNKVKELSKEKYQDVDHKNKLKYLSKEKYQTDVNHKNKVKYRSKVKYQTDVDHKNKLKYLSKEKYHTDLDHKNKVKQYSMDKYRSDSEHQKYAKLISKEKYKTDIDHRNNKKEKSKQKYRTNIGHRNQVKLISKAKYKNNSDHKNKIIRQNKERKLNREKYNSDIEKVIEEFNYEKNNGPEHICCVCHRLLFRNQVANCNENVYTLKDDKVSKIASECISKKYLHSCIDGCESNCNYPESYKSLWICYTCDRKIKNGKVPCEYLNNNLDPNIIPPQLDCLNSLEKHLISLHIPFMKMVNLGHRQQHKVSGETVCIPSNVNAVTNILPRSNGDDYLVRLKLKRKITYKGHYEYEFVTKRHLKDALQYLKENNKWYSDVKFNENWNFDEMTCNGKDAQINSYGDSESDEQDDLPDIDTTQNEVQLKGPAFDTCLQPLDIAQEFLDSQFDNIFSISPAENNNPVRILTHKGNEAMCFPALFPKGSHTFQDDREERITLSRYLNCRLMNADIRFARCTDYIFYAQYWYELSQIVSSVSIAMRKGNTGGNIITADMLTHEQPLKNILKSDEGYKFLKGIRGTPSYWQATQKDLFAMLRQLGLPTWFASFSSADMRWPELIETILKQQGDNRKADELDWAQKCEVLRSNPITAARMFDHRFHIFLKTVIMSKANPIGKIKDYFYRVEFQQRGSPHTHCLFWVEDAPFVDEDEDEKVVEFIDKYISCELPNEVDEPELHEIVSNVQKHSYKHSKSCKKNNKTCRFNFPRAPSKESFICRPVIGETAEIEDEEIVSSESSEISSTRAKLILESIWKALSDPHQNFDSVDELYNSLEINQDLFQKACEKITKKNYLVLKRQPKDVWINQYNPHLLKAWNGNLDIQYVFDAYSCIVYIVSYISKSEREMGLLLQQAEIEAKQGNLDVQSSLKKISNAYLHSREVSAQEAAYRVCNLRLKESSRKVQFIPTGSVNIRLTLPLKELKSKAQQGTLTDENMFMTSINDRYKARPDGYPFDDMCLATFCSEYRIMSVSEKKNETSEKNPAFRLKFDLGYVIKRSRTKPAVIRYARFSITKHPEDFYLSSLQLFLPHRMKEQLKPRPYETHEEFYKSGFISVGAELTSVKDIVDNNRLLYEKDAVNIDEAQEIVEKCGLLEDAWSAICPETELDRLECLQLQNNTNNAEDEEEPVNIPDLVDVALPKNSAKNIEPCPGIISRAQALPLLRSLNKIQSDIFYKVRQFCLDRVHKKDPEQFTVFVTGGAGTGKSHLIKSIYYESTRILAQTVAHPDDMTVLLCAPTGVSAYNISAATIHSTFSITTNAKLPYQPLGQEKMNTLRTKLGSVQILIIDEISMVDHKLLCYIHGRLRQIKQTSDYTPFGNVSVIAVGDFYQLPPVKGKSLYSSNELFNLWQDNFKIAHLQEIMRQKDDLAFAKALNRIRTKRKDESLTKDDLHLFSQRETGEESDAIHIFATNAQVNEHNLRLLHSKCEEPVVIEAKDYSKDKRTGKMKKLDKPLTSNVDSTLSNIIYIGMGARVMLIKNINVSDGLTNGTFGTVVYITMDNDNVPLIIHVRFDNDKVGKHLRTLSLKSQNIPEDSTPIEIQEETINYRGDVRRQFPIKLAYACTIHKVQGLTVENAVVSLKKVFAPGQAYVALSRVTALNGLIIKDFNEKVIYSHPDIDEALTAMPLFIEPITEQRKTTEIILLNIQGLMQHYQDLNKDYRFKECDFICLTETWITELAECSNIRMEGFNFYNISRQLSYDSTSHFTELKQKQHGGVGLYYNSGTRCNLLRIGNFNIEHLTFNIIDLDLTVVTIYRPPCYKADLFINYLQVLLTELHENGGNCIVMGDFNQNLLNSSSTIRTCMEDYGFRQLVNFGTTEGGTIIDHVYVKGISSSRISVKVMPTYFSYHEAVHIGIQ